jgi:hypothetical protein
MALVSARDNPMRFDMKRITTLSLAAALTFALAGVASAEVNYLSSQNPFPRINWTQLSNNCEFGEAIDGTSATDAKRRIEGAGFQNVRELRKGCDNVWHARASAYGQDVNVAVSPEGQVMRETE